MEIVLTLQAEEDLNYWKRTNNIPVLKRIRMLLENILETPYSGLGKPEGLKHELAGKWSRRITKSDRLVYQVTENKVFVFSIKAITNKNKHHKLEIILGKTQFFTPQRFLKTCEV